MHCCIHSTLCVPIMSRRRRGTRQESRKQALESARSMEMSKLTRDGTAEPVSRGQILRGKRGRQRIIHFPCSAADHEQDWQPCPVVGAIHTNIVLHTHTARCSYTYIVLLLLLFLTFSALVANPKKIFYTVANPARGLLNREKKKKEGKWTKVGITTPFSDKVGSGKMQTSSPPVITPNRS